MGAKSNNWEKTVRPWFICRALQEESGMMARPEAQLKSTPSVCHRKSMQNQPLYDRFTLSAGQYCEL